MDTPEIILAEQIVARMTLEPEAQIKVQFLPRHPVQGPGLIVSVDGKDVMSPTWDDIAEFLVKRHKEIAELNARVDQLEEALDTLKVLQEPDVVKALQDVKELSLGVKEFGQEVKATTQSVDELRNQITGG